MSVCYIPDHEPGVGTPVSELADEWIPALELARDASLLIHDCQYTDDEYRQHVGWGHCAVGDALEFARRARARNVLLFHHDPMHSDEFLDTLAQEIGPRWAALGGDPAQVELATERRELTLTVPVTTAAANT